MSDKARELADMIWGHYYNAEQGASKIDAALKAARLEAIEECKKAWRRVWMSPTTNYGDILGEIDRALDELKEAPDADAE